MENSLHFSHQRKDMDRLLAFSGGMFGLKREEVKDMDSPLINAGEKRGCRR